MHCKNKKGDRVPQSTIKTYEGYTNLIRTRNNPSIYVPDRHWQWRPRGILVSYQSLMVGVSKARQIYNLQIYIGNVTITVDTNTEKIRIDQNIILEHGKFGKFIDRTK